MDPATIDIATRLIGNLGFPIFVALWLLIRTDKLLRELTTVMNDLKDLVTAVLRKEMTP
jgi:hypothetical protein